MAQLEFSRLKWLPVAMTLSIALAVGLPYLLSAGLKQVQPFLPFIRHSAAYPPQSGIFSILISVAAFLGVFTFTLRYIVAKHRQVEFEENVFKRLNKASLAMGLLLNIFLMYTSQTSLGSRAPSRHKWIIGVLVPHHIGALFVCLCFNAYVLIQAYITYQQRKVFRKNVFMQIVFATFVIVSTWTVVMPLSASMKDMVKSLVADESHMVNFQYKEYSFYSIICAMSEWSFTFFSLLFIVSFYRDFEEMSVRFQLKSKRHFKRNSFHLPSPDPLDVTTKV